MIKVENMSFSFPEKDLYKQVSFELAEGVHCAFIGTNGTGKTTLADMLMRTEDYLYDGKIIKDDNCTIGYVSQFPEYDQEGNETVFQYISRHFVKLQNRINELCDLMAQAEDLDSIFEEYQQVLDEFQSIDGDNYENNIKKQLHLANLDHICHTEVSKISGGEFKLVQVIREMLLTPKLLVMDEPDVFLDFEHLNALCDLINNHKGTLLVITHNRYLLNNCFNKILHLENMQIQEFDGTYIEYNYKLLCTKIDLQEKAVADQEEIERNQKIVDKLRAEATYIDSATRGKALHARVSYLERLEARRTRDPFVDAGAPEIFFHTDREIPQDQPVLSLEDYQAGYDDRLLENVSFEIGARDKVAIVGQNGSGKTTMLRDLYRADKESISLAENVEVAYLSQTQGEVLDESMDIYQTFEGLGLETELEIREYLMEFGFEAEGFRRKISELSGGEKTMLQLAMICLSDANLLLLDEPTSHLDTYSQVALEKAIRNFNGAVIAVSHDFYTIANCMDYVLWVEDKTLRKMSIRKFRKMIYEHHFGKDYLELEQKKKTMEQYITDALREKNYKKARVQAEKLEPVVEAMSK